ncbi:acyl-CoA dehydrogenase family protein [Sciscionella marina]|uniref:acyl-CoA dehydrogenase family protein n=1 Tax=Sciscionella marina TaxID=508770 RepID=UPI00037BC61C|nr:acyl-CoA dehydrogenase family protein [Sciscionella marina]
MDFSFDARTESLRAELLSYMDQHVYPVEAQFAEAATATKYPWKRPEVMEQLKAEARRRGLWNLFLPHSPDGAGLSNLQYAPLAEITGRSPLIAPEALNCNPPDSGNMELLSMFASPRQRTEWLEPLLRGEIRSAYCMTEPAVASSDAGNIAARITRDGDEYVLDGRKWWITGALAEECRILLVLGVTDPDAPRKQRHSVLLVPPDTPGVRMVRPMHIMGYAEGVIGGHAEIEFDNVRVPTANLLGEVGGGTAMAQARLGPGRIHHAMRLVGMAERALELLCTRVAGRSAFGKPLADQGVLQERIAEARVGIEQLRLLVLRTAWLLDTAGVDGARTEVSAVKIAAPRTAEWVIDAAIQAHGAAGVSQDFPLAVLWAQARGLRIGDGPDEVHRMVLARTELRRYRTGSRGGDRSAEYAGQPRVE